MMDEQGDLPLKYWGNPALDLKHVFFLDSVLIEAIKLNATQTFRRVGDKLGYEIELRTA